MGGLGTFFMTLSSFLVERGGGKGERKKGGRSRAVAASFSSSKGRKGKKGEKSERVTRAALFLISPREEGKREGKGKKERRGGGGGSAVLFRPIEERRREEKGRKERDNGRASSSIPIRRGGGGKRGKEDREPSRLSNFVFSPLEEEGKEENRKHR